MDLVRDGSVLVLEGPLDGRCTFEVRTALYDQLASYDDVVVDVAGVEWIDATALRMLAVATRFAERGGQRLTIRGLNPHLRRALRHSRISNLLELESGADASRAM